LRVEVRLYATLAAACPDLRTGQPIDLEFRDEAFLPDLVRRLRIEPRAIHLVIVNGQIVHDHSCRLSDGDRVALFPPVGGG
jgi:molybdopterin synthase sulfur carrier subunit